MSLTSPMDGIPYLIWRDFPHPHGPNEHGRGLIPFTEFEITLARQILSYSFHRQQHPQQFIDAALLQPSDAAGDAPRSQQERVVRELPKRARDSPLQEEISEDVRWESRVAEVTATTFLEAPEEDDASTDGSELDVYDLDNPSLFSHRATVQDLIDSFHRNAIGPLAGVDVHDENEGEHDIVVVLAETPPALGRWEVEQEEHELEMRWRATKRVSENWLTRMQPVREQRERAREQRKVGTGAMGKLVTKDGAERRGDLSWPQSHPLVQQVRAGRGVGARMQAAPRETGSASRELGPEPITSTPINPSQATAPPPPLTHVLEHTPDPPISRNPGTSVSHPPTATTSSPLTSSTQLSARPRSHTPYDPRAPYFKELPLSDLIHVSPDPPEVQQLTFTGIPHGYEPLREGQFHPQHPRVAPAAQHVRYDYDSTGRVKCSCEIPSPPVAFAPQSQSTPTTTSPPDHLPTVSSSNLAIDDDSLGNPQLPVGSGGGAFPAPSLAPPNYSQPPVHESDHLAQLPQDDGTHIPRAQSHTLSQLPHSELRSPATPHGPPVRMQAVSGVPLPNPTIIPAPSNVNRVVPNPRPHPHSAFPSTHSHGYPPRGYPTPTHYHPYMTQQERNVVQDKIMRHITLLAQAPRITVGQVIVRNPVLTRASNLAPLFLALFPEHAGRDMGTFAGGAVRSGPTSSETPLGSSVRIQPQESTALTTALGEGVPQRPMPIAATHAASSSPAPQKATLRDSAPTSRPESPQTISTNEPHFEFIPRSIPECTPTGRRLVRVAKNFAGDVLGPTYWFEPDLETAEKLTNVVNLLQRSGGWKRPERKMTIVRGQRKARGPDDLV